MGTGTSVRTKLRKAIKYQLEQITTGNSYRKTINRVYDPPKNMEDMVEYPCVNLMWGREFDTEERKAGNRAMHDIHMTCRIEVFLHEHSDTIVDEIDKVLADVQEKFGVNYYITGEDDERTAFVCYYIGSEPFGTDKTKPNCGISIELSVHYRILIGDPTVMG